FACEHEMVDGAVDDAKPLPHVNETDSAAHRLIETLQQKAHAIVFNLDHDPSLFAPATNHDGADPHLPRKAMFDRVFDQRLENHARHHEIKRVGSNVLAHAQLRPEPDHFR